VGKNIVQEKRFSKTTSKQLKISEKAKSQSNFEKQPIQFFEK